jgi:hypothetical protein
VSAFAPSGLPPPLNKYSRTVAKDTRGRVIDENDLPLICAVLLDEGGADTSQASRPRNARNAGRDRRGEEHVRVWQEDPRAREDHLRQ